MFRKKVPVVLIIVGIVLLIASGLWFFFSRQLGSASITVESIPESNVYVNEELVGRTPYQGEFAAGEITLKLIPLAFDSPRVPFETKVNLVSGVDTVVRRSLGETELTSSGEVISFEINNSGTAWVSIITTPDNALVNLEGKPSEHSPIRFQGLEEKTYSLRIGAEGYQDRSFPIVTYKGYTLTAIVDLAKEAVIQETVPAENVEQKVKILSTPLGFLRVRQDASQDSDEVAQVESGDEFVLLESNEDSTWYRIQLIDQQEAETGWVSSEYAEIIQ